MKTVKNWIPFRLTSWAMLGWLSLMSLASDPVKLAAEGERARVIDRRALVTRHHVKVTRPDPLAPLTVGNGEFAFTADITGLQSFPEFYDDGIHLATQSQWAWHTIPDSAGYGLNDVLERYEVGGNSVPYASDERHPDGYSPAGTWLRSNPHRLDLARIGLRLKHADGREGGIEALTAVSQTLELWSGQLHSSFEVAGYPVDVITVCHPDRDLLGVRISSPLLADDRLRVRIAFPYGRADWRRGADWESRHRHTTAMKLTGDGAMFTRVLDQDRYSVRVGWSAPAELEQESEHVYEIVASDSDTLELAVEFAPSPLLEALPQFADIRSSSAAHWRHFWSTGGAVDFSESSDPRASELERRVVLSQYLTAIQCAGSCPPQETGLSGNSWYGKFHLEMHWWHGVHFALWNRLSLLERSLPWYESILPKAKATAAAQGYRGARWPKMVAPDGRESPSRVGVFLIWQQPHPIYYAELCYRTHQDRATLERYRDMVFETADFMASYPVWNQGSGRYELGPALIPAQESYGKQRNTNLNPTFELAYWHWGLATAQRWRERLGLKPHPQWDRVLESLSRPMIRDGIYTGIATAPYTIRRDHPSVVAAFGFVPATPLIDPETMQRTLDDVFRTWRWESTWGWDYPMLAMTAARLRRPEQAVEALFINSPKNRFLANGHNYQSTRLPLYLPGNGGLLTAVAMMAAGWEGAPDRRAPGFPDNGAWIVRYEGLKPLP